MAVLRPKYNSSQTQLSNVVVGCIKILPIATLCNFGAIQAKIFRSMQKKKYAVGKFNRDRIIYRVRVYDVRYVRIWFSREAERRVLSLTRLLEESQSSVRFGVDLRSQEFSSCENLFAIFASAEGLSFCALPLEYADRAVSSYSCTYELKKKKKERLGVVSIILCGFAKYITLSSATIYDSETVIN